MKAIAGVNPVAFLAATLALGSCARSVEIERPSPGGRDIGPELWRYFEPVAAGDSRDPLLERVKDLARREKATAPEVPAAEQAPAPEETPPVDEPAVDVADEEDDRDEKAPSVIELVSPPSAPAPPRLGPGDEIDIVVGGQPEFSGLVTVRDDGRVALPTTGDLVDGKGITTGELAGRIVRALHPRYLRAEPEVSITLRSRGGAR